jgi:PAS domain S-box-containing protein
MEMKKILVVDDEPANVELLKGLLSKKYAVETAANGKEAFTKVKDISPDLILLDVIMPEIDGYEVCRQLKSDQTTMNIPIVMVTCLNDRDDRIKAIEAGADDFLSKPIDWIELDARVKSLIRIKQYHEDLEEIRNRYIELYDFAPVGYFTFNRNGLIMEVNLTGGALIGLARQDLMIREFRSFVVPEDLELWDRHISNALNSWDEQSCELTLKRETGSTLFVRLNSIRMEKGDGTPEIRTAMIDITQHKNTTAGPTAK